MIEGGTRIDKEISSCIQGLEIFLEKHMLSNRNNPLTGCINENREYIRKS
jgi:hypothetical protein